MRICLVFLSMFSWISAFSQVQDDFSDGDFTSNPIWNGDLSAFRVNPAGQLQTTGSPAGQTAALATANPAMTGRWEFYLQLNFSPSANNQARVYLVSDQADLKASLQGYFVQVGESGNLDSYDLYRQNGTTVTAILRGKDQPRADVNLLVARIVVTRDENGLWAMESDPSGGRNFSAEGTATDKTFTSTAWFGITARYTSTNAERFVFDDFSFIAAQPPPPSYIAKRNDVVINEIFADPSPPVNLPSAEFVELWNTSLQPISLKGWQYGDGTTIVALPADTIRPGAFIILCARTDTGLFSAYGKVIGIAPWPSLNNSGELLTLKSDQGTVISQEYYSDTWYRETAKRAGGWSLEMEDPSSICPGSRNWRAAVDLRGGSPGAKNSVYRVSTSSVPLQLSGARMIDSTTIRLLLNRSVDSVTASFPAVYQVNNGLGKPVSAVPVVPEFNAVDLHFSSPVKRGQTYEISVSGVSDCAGNLLLPEFGAVTFFYPEKIRENAVLLSEILFNPPSGGVDFVEIYNASDQVLNLGELSVATLSNTDSLENLCALSDSVLLINPGAYLAFSTDPEVIKATYTVKDPAALLKMKRMPAFNDDAGTLVLVSGNERIDQFSYHEKMHFPLIGNPEGVSLERSDFKRAAHEAGNFRSAATWTGGATPGYRNSQFVAEVSSREEVYLSSDTFSPDNDGFEDLLVINFQFPEAGKVASAAIYSDKGALIQRIVKNETLPSNGTLIWNGLNDLDEKQPIGIYAVFLEVFDLTGRVKSYKKYCVLAGKL